MEEEIKSNGKKRRKKEKEKKRKKKIKAMGKELICSYETNWDSEELERGFKFKLLISSLYELTNKRKYQRISSPVLSAIYMLVSFILVS